jgi:hypothetical protein
MKLWSRESDQLDARLARPAVREGEPIMNDLHNDDSDLWMSRETLGPWDGAHRRFLRWLAERGLLEHLAAGPPSGELAAARGAEQRRPGAA